jgi:hypothetical protein
MYTITHHHNKLNYMIGLLAIRIVQLIPFSLHTVKVLSMTSKWTIRNKLNSWNSATNRGKCVYFGVFAYLYSLEVIPCNTMHKSFK